jgi:hypothetical protein
MPPTIGSIKQSRTLRPSPDWFCQTNSFLKISLGKLSLKIKDYLTITCLLPFVFGNWTSSSSTSTPNQSCTDLFCHVFENNNSSSRNRFVFFLQKQMYKSIYKLGYKLIGKIKIHLSQKWLERSLRTAGGLVEGLHFFIIIITLYRKSTLAVLYKCVDTWCVHHQP